MLLDERIVKIEHIFFMTKSFLYITQDVQRFFLSRDTLLREHEVASNNYS